jgi:hypothetical protein
MRSLCSGLPRCCLRPAGVMALVMLAAVGCAAGRGDVSGKVTYKGKALVSGTVQLEAADKTLMQANIGNDGSYSIPGVPLGEARVAVSSTNPQGPDSQPLVRGERGDRQPTTPKAAPPVAGWFPISSEYGDINKSRLTYTVKKGPNTYDIDLK